MQYIYEKVSATGPYTRPAGTYTRYGDVLPLLTELDDQLVVFGSGDEVRLDFDPSNLPALPQGWVRDYFFAANGYEKDMDFYAAEGNYVAPLPFLKMGDYPYPPGKSFPLDDAHVNYLLEYNTRQCQATSSADIGSTTRSRSTISGTGEPTNSWLFWRPGSRVSIFDLAGADLIRNVEGTIRTSMQ